MRVRDFDRDFAQEMVDRLSKLPRDRPPRWGRMHAVELVPHLTHTLQYAMGRLGPLPFTGNWLTRRVVGPLVLNGTLPIPRNINLPQPHGAPEPDSGSLETLHAVLEDYLASVETGALRPPHHALFGDIGVDGWARLHVRHFEHHLKQFGL